jgi:crotonobetainyl-CoA:carnitine CoA-transferase CaiB-like acyl-CoA transferase
MDAAGVPGGPVYSFEQTLADPQVAARKMVVEIDHPKIGMMKTLGLPIKSTGELTEIRKPAPLLGQHTEEVLAEIGYGKADIEAMIAGGAAFADRS